MLVTLTQENFQSKTMLPKHIPKDDLIGKESMSTYSYIWLFIENTHYRRGQINICSASCYFALC